MIRVLGNLSHVSFIQSHPFICRADLFHCCSALPVLCGVTDTGKQNLDKSALGVMLAAARYARQDESRATAQPLPASRSSQLLSKCLGASSQDHPGEVSVPLRQ